MQVSTFEDIYQHCELRVRKRKGRGRGVKAGRGRGEKFRPPGFLEFFFLSIKDGRREVWMDALRVGLKKG